MYQEIINYVYCKMFTNDNLSENDEEKGAKNVSIHLLQCSCHILYEHQKHLNTFSFSSLAEAGDSLMTLSTSVNIFTLWLVNSQSFAHKDLM